MFIIITSLHFSEQYVQFLVLSQRGVGVNPFNSQDLIACVFPVLSLPLTGKSNGFEIFQLFAVLS